MPQPSVARYWAIVVVKLPELENRATEPLISASSGTVAAERPAEAHAVPGIGHAEAVGAEDVDADALADGADLARIMHRDFFGDDDDLAQVRIDAHELGHTVARAGRAADRPRRC